MAGAGGNSLIVPDTKVNLIACLIVLGYLQGSVLSSLQNFVISFMGIMDEESELFLNFEISKIGRVNCRERPLGPHQLASQIFKISDLVCDRQREIL